MLHVNHLEKSFGPHVALHDVSLSLEAGTVALLGQNGSGKSTLLRILATLLKPDSGHIQLGAWDYRQHMGQLRAQIGYLPQDLELPEDMTPHKLLTYLVQIRGGQAVTSMGRIVDRLQLAPILHTKMNHLSGGELRLVGIAQAFLGQPHLYLLDEVFRGLSIEERRRVSHLMKQQTGLTLFSSHIPAEAANLAQTVIVLHQGHVLYCGPTQTFIDRANGSVYEMTVPTADLPHLLKQYTVSRIQQQATISRMRIIGTPLNGSPAMHVEPTAEDAYLLLLNKSGAL